MDVRGQLLYPDKETILILAIIMLVVALLGKLLALLIGIYLFILVVTKIRRGEEIW